MAGAGKMLTSVLKKPDNAVFNTIADAISGKFTAGTARYGLDTDGVGLAPFHEASPYVSQSVREELEGSSRRSSTARSMWTRLIRSGFTCRVS